MSSIIMIIWCWSLASDSFLGVVSRLWLAYTGCQMTWIEHLSEESGPHFNCCNMWTIWIINHVLSLRCQVITDHVQYLAQASFVVVCVFFFARCPYDIGIHGNSCLWGQLPAFNNVWTDLYLTIIIVRHVCQLLSCVYHWESRVHYGVYPIYS